jgi:L-iditol 2-dehydrogenase
VRAALLESVGSLKITDVAPPTLDSSTQLLIAVRAVGICGSEIHAFNGTHPFRKPPSVLGHEVSGQVVEVGEQVRGFAPGDRVFVDPQWTCGECAWCLSGRHNLCLTKVVLGTREWSGGLGEYVVAPVESVYHIADHVSYVEATLIEPLSVGIHMVEEAKVRSTESVAILGAGVIGMMVSAAASVRGAAPIVAVDVQQHCLSVVRESFGATHSLLAQQVSVPGGVQDITGGRGVDVVFLTVGVSSLINEALVIAAREGRISFVALFDETIELHPNDVIDKHLHLSGTSMYNVHDIRFAIDLISSGKVRAGAMVTHVLPLEEAQRGFELAATKNDGAIKVVLEMGD